MHRFLIQSMKSLWPNLEDQFEGWKKFPKEEEDYPSPLINQFKAWPDEVLKSGVLVDRLMKMSNDERLGHWKSESEFGHWLECGTELNETRPSGMDVDALYGALIHNGRSDIPNKNTGKTDYRLNTYLFWKIHGWIDRSWNKYRKKISKTPYDTDLQAELLNQCQIFLGYTQQALTLTTANQPTNLNLFIDGELNSDYTSKAVELLGEIIAIEKTLTGKTFYQLDLKRKGVKRIWATGLSDIASSKLRVGKRFVFIGRIKDIERFSNASELSALLKSKNILEAESIQTPK